MDSSKGRMWTGNNGRNAVVEGPKVGLAGKNGRNAVVEGPKVGLAGKNGRNAVVEGPKVGLVGKNGRNAVVESPKVGLFLLMKHYNEKKTDHEQCSPSVRWNKR
ncbi:hypothetical protein D3C75_1068550 [compost metagenome]